MSIKIEDGKGKGFSAGVDENNKLLTASVTVTKEHEINLVDGQAYSVFTNVTPTGGGDCFMYLKNNSNEDLIVSEMMIYSATAESFSIKLGDEGTPIGGTATTPANRNAGSGNAADVTALTGVDITGLSGGNVVFGFTKGAEANSNRIAPASGFIVPKNKVLTVYVETGGVAIRFGMGISFHSKSK